jgi:hypothetical protein
MPDAKLEEDGLAWAIRKPDRGVAQEQIGNALRITTGRAMRG